MMLYGGLAAAVEPGMAGVCCAYAANAASGAGTSAVRRMRVSLEQRACIMCRLPSSGLLAFCGAPCPRPRIACPCAILDAARLNQKLAPLLGALQQRECRNFV